MRHRRSLKRPDRRREGSSFFAPTRGRREAPASSAFFQGVVRQERAAQTIDEHEPTAQGEHEEDRASQDAEAREPETMSQEGQREEHVSQDAPEGEELAQGTEHEEQVSQADREEAMSQEDKSREEAVVAQSPATTTRAPSFLRPNRGKAARGRGGDGQRRTASRFSGDHRVAAARGHRNPFRMGSRGAHVVRLQQALVERGFQLPGVGVDGKFGPETDDAVRRYQASRGLVADGVVGVTTMDSLDFDRPTIPVHNSKSLRTDLRSRVGNGEEYGQLSAVIRRASFLERYASLMDQRFLREMSGALSWNDFARIVELLGLTPPTGAALLGDPAVQAALADAWRDSNVAATAWSVDNSRVVPPAPCNPSEGRLPTAAETGTHEEGGWIYLNVITGGIYTRRAPPGGQAGISIGNPPLIQDSIVVGVFHTHPNVGSCWDGTASAGDQLTSQSTGIPVLVRGQVDGVTRDMVAPAPGVSRRAHLSGPRGLPRAGGALEADAKALPAESP